MISKPLDQITESDLRSLIDVGREEGAQLDFKRDLPKEDHEGRKEFFSDITAFANTSGGDLVYGMLEKDGFASEIVPQTIPMSVDGYVLKLQSSIRDRIEPIVQGAGIHPIPLQAGGHAVVIRIPRSFSGMHRVRGDGHFYVRKSRSNSQLDVPGIISKVSDYLGREDRIKSFFARRYADILVNEHAIPIAPGPKLVVHILPVRDFLDGQEIDIDIATKDRSIPLLSHDGSHSTRNTYDGKAFYAAQSGTATHFTLLMRSGVVEACTNIIPDYWPEDMKKVDLRHIEDTVLHFLRTFLSASFAAETTSWPCLVRVALLGTNGLPFRSGTNRDVSSHYGLPPRQPLSVLSLPDVLLEAESIDINEAMRESFTRMWHSWGYPGNFSYHEAGGDWTRR
jgi:hypothetical protein